MSVAGVPTPFKIVLSRLKCSGFFSFFWSRFYFLNPSQKANGTSYPFLDVFTSSGVKNVKYTFCQTNEAMSTFAIMNQF